METIMNAFIPVICLIITAAGGLAVVLIKKYTAQIEREIDNETAEKYIDLASAAVIQAVTYVAQTYVDELKRGGKFTEARQRAAFDKAKATALEILGEQAVEALREIYGDFDAWIDTKIETVCREIKGGSSSAPGKEAME